MMRELSLNELEARKRLENTIVNEFRRGLMSGESEILRRSFTAGLDHAAEQVAALQADNERLRAALAEIAAFNSNAPLARRLVEIARQALDNLTT